MTTAEGRLKRALQRVPGARHLVEVAVLEGLETRLAEDGVMVAPCGVGAIDVDARVELSKELGRDAEGSGARERLADGNLLILDQGRILAQNDLCLLNPAILVSNTFSPFGGGAEGSTQLWKKELSSDLRSNVEESRQTRHRKVLLVDFARIEVLKQLLLGLHTRRTAPMLA